ncbi:MAG TPA: YlxR family protein [Polyangiaceae bacterium]|nr:YlxR family protein [Polyangiaceae bacterium]
METKEPKRGSRANPVRTCVSCSREDAPDALVRFVLADDGTVVPDLAGGLPGRGAWVHPTRACLAKATGGFSRSFRAQVNSSPARIAELLAKAGEVRAHRLLGTARRQGQVAGGATLVEEAWADGRVHGIVVARDARAAADLPVVAAAVPRGFVRVFSTKDLLGRPFGRPELGILAVLDERLAKSLFEAIALALLDPESNTTSAAHGSGTNGFSEDE